jgi:histidinol-phosphate phosphatase family protein
MATSRRNRAVFLDRDGVLIEQVDGKYVTKPEQIKVLPEVGNRIATINRAGWLVCVVTNQACVHKDICTNEDVKEVHNKLIEMLAVSGARINSFVWCPHTQEEECYCRKPRPGMLYRMAVGHHLDLRECLMIGDSERDMLAARAAGCQFYEVKKNVGIAQWDPKRLLKMKEIKILPRADQIKGRPVLKGPWK